ncbi:MAG: hypothetical protein ACI8UO_004248 [Verrucomicrobiales bacterium]
MDLNWDPIRVGPPGEVTQTDLDTAIATRAGSVSGMTPLALIVSDPPSQIEVQTIADRLDELIAMLQA